MSTERQKAGTGVSGQPRVVIAGASGFIGPRLARDWQNRGYAVSLIGRNGPDARWNDADAVHKLIDGSDVLINMAGKSVNCRYNDANRNEILRSRVDTTRQLNAAVAASAKPPRLWLNSSTATIYRYSMDRPMDEETGELGSGFSVDVARNWEREFFAGELPGTRRVALRMAIVIGDGPATRLLFRLARWGLGGPQFDGWWFGHRRYRGIGTDPSGDGRVPRHRSRGRQKFSWVHIDDVLGAIAFLADHDDIAGTVNVSAPEVSDNRTLMAALRGVTGRRWGLPAYRWMLEPAMWLLRTEPELLVKSRWVVPRRLQEAGYRFRWNELEPALKDIGAKLP